MKYEYVSDQARFAALCADWSELPAVGLDTEFIRTRTYYPKTGLLQFGVESGCYLVDPLAIDDWEPCRQLLASTRIIIHAAGEDLGLLLHLLGEVPLELFDTQLAAAFLGVGFSLSYRDMVKRFCGVELPKSETRSNWLKRPLSPAQLRYAAEDVRFLPALHDSLAGQLEREGKLEWFADDCRELLAAARRNEDPQSWLQAHLQINEHDALNDRGLFLLQRLCCWREKEIRSRDLPRNWLVGDRDLLLLATALENHSQITPEAIRDAAGVNPKFAARFASRLVQYLNGAEPVQAQTPQRKRAAVFGPAERDRLKRCRNLAQQEAERMGLSPELLARRRQLQQIVHSRASTGNIDWPPEMHGWRQRVLDPVLAQELSANRRGSRG